MLFSNELRPGSQLPPERALAEQFGVGRPLIREVLGRLQERGLVTVVPGRGSFTREARLTESGGSVEVVARRGMVTPRQLIAARRMLESEAAALAAQNRTEQDLVDLHELVEILDSSDTAQRLINADVMFHEAIAEASKNPVVQIMFGSIRNLVEGIVLRSHSDAEVRSIAVPSHHLILDAIESQDSISARAAMTDHLEVASRLYGPDLDRPIRDVIATTPGASRRLGLSPL